MLPQHEVKWVRWLFEQGLSRRAIAQKTGFSRDTIRRILDRQGPHTPDDEDQQSVQRLLFSGPLRRCPECGGRVYMPCMTCRIRKFHDARLPRAMSQQEIAAARPANLAADALRQRRQKTDGGGTSGTERADDRRRA